MRKTLLLLSNNLDGFKVGLSFSDQVHDIIKKHEERRPFHLNVIEAVCHGTFRETGHSLVLADMLKHPDIRSSFLERFLNLKYNELEVFAERDRVDVALKGNGIFVIIENKVNAAEEQKSQVYRYVHEIGIDKYGYKLSEIYVIYLNRETIGYGDIRLLFVAGFYLGLKGNFLNLFFSSLLGILMCAAMKTKKITYLKH